MFLYMKPTIQFNWLFIFLYVHSMLHDTCRKIIVHKLRPVKLIHVQKIINNIVMIMVIPPIKSTLSN